MGDKRDVGSILGQEDPPAEGNGNSLQYSCQENFMSCQESDMTERACTELSGIHSGSPHTPPQCYQHNPEGPSKCTSDHPLPPTSANKKERSGEEEKEGAERGGGGVLSQRHPELLGTFWHVILGKCLQPSFPQLQTKAKHTRGWATQKSPIFSSPWLTTMTFSCGSTDASITELLWDEGRWARCLAHRDAPWTLAVVHVLIPPSAQSYLLALQTNPTPLAIFWSQAASSMGIWVGGAPGGLLLLLLQPISGVIFISGHFCRADICLAQRKIVSATSSNKNDFLHALFVYNCLSNHSHC